MSEEEIGAPVVDSAIKVHSVLGPGLLESAYSARLAHELEMRGLDVSQEKPLSAKDGIKRVVWTMKFSFASFASFAVQD